MYLTVVSRIGREMNGTCNKLSSQKNKKQKERDNISLFPSIIIKMTLKIKFISIAKSIL